MMILSILATVVLLGVLFYHRVSLFLSSLILLAWTAALGAAGLWNIWLLVPLAIILLPFNLAPMRKSMISAPVFKGFRKVMPPMSRTEKEAIDAGTTWWEGDLFQGNPDWKKLHNYPQPRLTAEEQAFIDGPVEEACRMANDFAITHEMADLPPELWAYLKEHRFFAMIIKKEYGGLEFSAYAQARVLQKLAGVSGILAITVGVPNSLGPGELLQHYGTEEQKDHYLPRLARGQEIPCFALTSPEAGSDAGAIPDTGVVCMGEWQGEQVLGMRLTWNKRYITLAPIATVLGLAHMIMALHLPLRLRVLIPAVENVIAGNALKPKDILISRKGLTVEVNDTDAEGRLVLADALALACEEETDALISMATLTGAARAALPEARIRVSLLAGVTRPLPVCGFVFHSEG